MNLSDSERVRTVLESMGFVPTENEEEATILGIIACSVRQKGIDKVYSRILKWNEMKLIIEVLVPKTRAFDTYN